MGERVGFGFRPTDVELLGYYLRIKLTGSTHFVDETINDINIYSFDPWELRFQSKVKPMDPVWYFFSSTDRQSRKTSSGFWKITGQPMEVEDQWGNWCRNRGKIGYKRVLVFHKGKIAIRGKAEWVMHEYHLTILPETQRTHVICRVEYKGDNISFLYDNATELSPAFVQQLTVNSGLMFNTPEQLSYFASNGNGLLTLPEQDIEEALDILYDREERNVIMQENYNDNRPKSPVTKVFDDDSMSDSENESTLFGDTSSSEDSVGNTNELCFTLIPPPLSSIDQATIEREQFGQDYANYKAEEVKKEMQGKEKMKSKWYGKWLKTLVARKVMYPSRIWRRGVRGIQTRSISGT